MAFQPCPNIMEAKIHYIQDLQDIENVLHVRQTSGIISATDVQAVAGAIDAWVTGSVMPLLSQDLAYQRTNVRDLTTQFSFIGSAGNVSAGGVNVGAVPSNVSIAISARTGHAGRGGNGRSYVPGIPSSDVVGNQLGSVFANAILTAWRQLRTVVFAGPYQICVLSRRIGGVMRANGVPEAITDYEFTDLTVDSQRDRLPGHKAKRHGP